ncbi:sal-like protein 3 [Silurus asotus]|uniref:Sal-like protein 1 n=1 Tax=Silurus asotus TaxID=30991 RepID=A0AAD5AIC9_SILAS|nr:sal-like protein 3 [Silurus asotus]
MLWVVPSLALVERRLMIPESTLRYARAAQCRRRLNVPPPRTAAARRSTRDASDTDARARDTSRMSRRKQAKPQHVTAGEETELRGRGADSVLFSKGSSEESVSESHSMNEVTFICKTCCAEFFNWSELLEHQNKCTEDPPVLIVHEDERFPSPQGSPTESYLSAHSDPDETETMEPESESSEKGEENVSLPEENDAVGADDPMDTTAPVDKISNPSPLPPDSSESAIPLPLSCLSTNYGIPSTNVTLEILHSTRVAVAQFSQRIQGDGSGGKGNSVAIPMILEQLMALQQQQVHQLQLIEQIRSQVAVMNRQPTQGALNPASKAFPTVSCTYHFQGIAPPPPVLPLSGVMPSTVNGQASVSQASRLEGSLFRVSQPQNKQSNPRENENTSIPLANPNASLSTFTGVSPLLSSCNGALYNASRTQPLNSPHPHSVSQNNVINNSANLPLLPQSPPSGVIFPNPLASIAATTNALEPLASMIKHRSKGKMPNTSMFETKPSSEDPFFKHKCRFCAKVFGSDSALQIHLRSHTGERPFKCNICGNRFSTKGNLKVHYQRHKDKYPHVQMNPYPVPEYLDNIPTSSGIPYGMSFPPEKAGSTWLDSKPILQTLPPRLGLQLPPTITNAENINDSFSDAPAGRSLQMSSLAKNESTPLSSNANNTEKIIAIESDNHLHTAKMACFQVNKEVGTTTVSKNNEIYLPSNCVTDSAENSNSASHNVVSNFPSTETPIRLNTPEPTDVITPVMKSSTPSQLSEHIKASFTFSGIQESMQTSETSKLQQLVENIDKKMMDPNQCVICHRVLSCQSALKMHYRIHTGERPFKCKVCGRAFTTKGNLKTHFGVHRTKPPLQVQHSCPICQKKFTNAVVLQQHIRMHMGGQIPNNIQNLPTDTIQEKNNDLILGENNFDSVNDYDDDGLDDISYEDEDISENSENLLNALSDCSSAPISPLPPDVSDVRTSDGDSTVSLSQLTEHKVVMSGIFDNHPEHDFPSAGDLENQKTFLPESANIIHSPTLKPTKSQTEGLHEIPVSINITFNRKEQAATVKCEMSDSPGALYDQIRKSSVMEQGVSQRYHDMEDSLRAPVKLEMEISSRPYTPKEGPFPVFGSIQSSPTPSDAIIPGMTSLFGSPPPRRAPKQHNCNVCGKNFSSASALQIHERTHTGEKPFACSICGRAFTTKGNLKVHMGTHMWNNIPARRGRRLSVENPLALLGAEALKFNEVFQKDLAARAIHMDQNFWSRYAVAISNGLAMKNNEISVIQNGGVSQLPTAAMDKTNSGNSPAIRALGKTSVDLGPGRHFSMLIDDNKEIRIN